MRSDPLISVIINCYNSEQFLKEAINSVFIQTYKNWEIVFWDNNSTDSSAEIALNFGKKIRYFKSKSTTRLYAARNLAVEKAEGDYIAFLDSDDIWTEDHLECLIAKANKNFKIVYGDYDFVNSSGEYLSGGSSVLPSGFIQNRLFKKNTISIGCILIERKLLQNYLFDDFYDLLGDFDLWIRLAENNRFGVVPRIIEHSRQHSHNLSKTQSSRFLVERRRLYRKNLKLKRIISTPWLIYYILKTELLGIITR